MIPYYSIIELIIGNLGGSTQAAPHELSGSKLYRISVKGLEIMRCNTC